MAITNEILNYSLLLSMEFGENWLMPINQRLHSRFSDLNPSELERCNGICKQINTRAHRFVAEHLEYTGTEIGFIEFQSFKLHMLAKYDWISETNLTSLYSQSCYYAYK